MLRWKEKGFSLPEVMIAVGILGVAALGISDLMRKQSKTTKTIEAKFEYGAVMNDIREILGDYRSCTTTFGGQKALGTPEGTVTIIKQRANATYLDKYPSGTTKKYGQGNFELVSYRLIAPPADTNVGIPPGGNEGATYLIVKFDMGDKKVYSARVVEKKIKLNVVTDGSADHKIVKCTSQGAIADNDAHYVNVTGDTMTGDLMMGDGAVAADIVMMGNSQIDFQSDARLKEDIHSLPSVIKKLRKLRPVSYRWKESHDTAMGLVAQELAQIYPELVSTGRDNYLRVNYVELTPVLIRGLQEVDKENRELRARVDQLSSEQKELKKMILELRKEIGGK
jgi:prepilin-type N-terminal cleavage/methylation domain-containing protein